MGGGGKGRVTRVYYQLCSLPDRKHNCRRSLSRATRETATNVRTGRYRRGPIRRIRECLGMGHSDVDEVFWSDHRSRLLLRGGVVPALHIVTKCRAPAGWTRHMYDTIQSYLEMILSLDVYRPVSRPAWTGGRPWTKSALYIHGCIDSYSDGSSETCIGGRLSAPALESTPLH